VTSAYLMACRNAGVELSMPEQCVRCNGGLVGGEEKRSERATGIDVIFVVEMRSCINNRRSSIGDLAKEMEKKDRTIRFGWIGYGGDGVHRAPHTHTHHDSTHMDAAAIAALSGVDFNTESGIEASAIDPMSAVNYAVEHYEYRFGANKMIILWTCRACDFDLVDQYALQNGLLNQAIVLHLMSHHSDVDAGDEVSNVVGFNATTLYSKTGSSVGNRADLRKPNDICSVIAQETHGSVFSTLAPMPIVASRTIDARTNANSINCQICHCDTIVDRMTPHTVCTPCDVIQPASLTSSSFTGLADFFRSQTRPKDEEDTFFLL